MLFHHLPATAILLRFCLRSEGTRYVPSIQQIGAHLCGIFDTSLGKMKHVNCTVHPLIMPVNWVGDHAVGNLEVPHVLVVSLHSNFISLIRLPS